MARVGIMDMTTNTIVNIIELEPDSDWIPDKDHKIVIEGNINIGYVWNGTEFVNPYPISISYSKELRDKTLNNLNKPRVL